MVFMFLLQSLLKYTDYFHCLFGVCSLVVASLLLSVAPPMSMKQYGTQEEGPTRTALFGTMINNNCAIPATLAKLAFLAASRRAGGRSL